MGKAQQAAGGGTVQADPGDIIAGASISIGRKTITGAYPYNPLLEKTSGEYGDFLWGLSLSAGKGGSFTYTVKPGHTYLFVLFDIPYWTATNTVQFKVGSEIVKTVAISSTDGFTYHFVAQIPENVTTASIIIEAHQKFATMWATTREPFLIS